MILGKLSCTDKVYVCFVIHDACNVVNVQHDKQANAWGVMLKEQAIKCMYEQVYTCLYKGEAYVHDITTNKNLYIYMCVCITSWHSSTWNWLKNVHSTWNWLKTDDFEHTPPHDWYYATACLKDSTTDRSLHIHTAKLFIMVLEVRKEVIIYRKELWRL